ncbi:MAG: hypothetical protein FJ039_01200 [Chloroflexi bacterium]|nr:hypothetical protein [Chloroflexota bacterium]
MSSAVSTGKYGLHTGKPEIRSIGPIAFGPESILFAADNSGAKIFAFDVRDTDVAHFTRPVNVENLDTRLAAYLGCSRDDLTIRDVAVHKASQNLYLSVMRGSGASAIPVLVKLTANGALSAVSFESIPFAQTAVEKAPSEDDPRLDGRVVPDSSKEGELRVLPGGNLRLAREKLRTVTVTDLAYVDGVLIVAGACNEEFTSALRRIPFPFSGKTEMHTVEIFHVSHGKYETASPIRNFVPFAGNKSILASYTCTPIVHIPVKDVAPGAQIKGKTVAELGARNTPLDMVSYKLNGEEFLLVSNARHPLMKIAGKDVERQEALTQPKEPLGVPRKDLPHQGVTRMANLDSGHVVMLQQEASGSIHLRTYRAADL